MTDPAVRVLYIDDDAGVRRLAARALARRGYAVTPAEDGRAGVELAAAGGYDVIAVDHYMPGLDGLETLAAIRALPAPPPVVYVTGSEESAVAIAALKAGAADYVVKTVGQDFYDLLAAAFDQVHMRHVLEREKERVESDLRATNARLEALLHEVNHRVANSLQLVSAMVRLQAGALGDSTARGALEDTERRIHAIAQVHRRLYTNDDVESVDMKEYLSALVDELAQAWTKGGRRTLTLAIEPMRLATDRAVSLGVIVNELVSNALKYAYPANTTGEVRVALRREGDSGLTLVVEDDGVGMMPVPEVKGTGLGSRLVRAMAQSLGGAVEYDSSNGGLRATLRAALS